ncbi:hypothetical protein ACKI1I_42835 [Streptomyces turgidiscabies]|uniref:hypothetical protein n=1 Tax=Streptomyces turgidiscabies TaxID=85558 RepID=UPI0038F63C82
MARSVSRTDHLRSRGEHLVVGMDEEITHGSPPLARRAQELLTAAVARGWITSARAESTSTGTTRLTRTPDHLRTRGEHNPTVRG